MADFGLVLFEKADKGSKSLADLLRRMGFFKSRLGSGIFYLLRRKAFTGCVTKLCLTDSLNAYAIALPIPVSSLGDFNLAYLGNFIERVCHSRSIKDCYIPSSCSYSFPALYRSKPASSLIYKSLLLEILDEVYTKSGLRIGSLDTAIVAGSDLGELCALVRLLEPRVRYVTVLTSDKEQAEAQLSLISDESGLAVSTSSDFKNVLRSAELIINLEDTAAISKFRTMPKSLMINLNEQGRSKIRGENTVINGVEYELPQELQQRFGKELSSFYSKKELADIFVTNDLGLGGEISLNDALIGRIIREFRVKEMKITGFTGRRGVLRAENVLKAVKM